MSASLFNFKINKAHTMTKKIVVSLVLLLLSTPVTRLFAQDFPNQKWEYTKNPEQFGWGISQLDNLRTFIIDSTQITGFIIVYKGKVVFEYGDTEENSYIASCRKSVLAMIYGEYVISGEIDLNKSLKDLGIDDIGGLMSTEKEATVKDIISARSGVFHPASYPGDYLKYAPKRGSVKHGEYWLYSNWDFNLAGYIFEKETKRNIYDEVERILSIPLQMQDWKRSLQQKEGDTTISLYKAYPMWFSTRDMARLGLLMLNKGKWHNKQILDENWVKEMIKPVTNYSEVNKNIPAFQGSDYYFGYGYLWWLWQNVKDDRFKGGYSALGSMGQSISVFPSIDAVVVFKTKDAYERSTPYRNRFKVLRLAVQAYDSSY
jgi:CubicO group peptidase (beta-lactamase class C family)